MSLFSLTPNHLSRVPNRAVIMIVTGTFALAIGHLKKTILMMNIYIMEMRQRNDEIWNQLFSIVVVKWDMWIDNAVTVIKCVINLISSPSVLYQTIQKLLPPNIFDAHLVPISLKNKLLVAQHSIVHTIE